MKRFVYLLCLMVIGCDKPPANRQIKIEIQTCIEPTLLTATGEVYEQCRGEIGVASLSELSGCFIWQDDSTQERIELFWAEGWRSTQSLSTQLSPTSQSEPLAVFFMGTNELDCNTLDRTTPCDPDLGCLLKLVDGQFTPGEQPTYTFSHDVNGCDVISDVIDPFTACIDCTEQSCDEPACQDGSIQPCDTVCGLGEQRCQDGHWTDCVGPEPQTELCLNGVDDDCDQQVDEYCETCSVTPLNEDTYFAPLSHSYQAVPLISIAGTSWLAWYAGTQPRKGYIRGFSLEQTTLDLTNVFELPIHQISDLVLLDGGVIAHIGVVNQQEIHVNYHGQSGTSDTTVFESDDTVWDAALTGTAFDQQIIYRTNALYLKRIERADPRHDLQPLRLSTKVNHLGHAIVQGGDRTSIFYQDDTGAFPEGRVLSLIQVSSDGQTLIRENPIVDPSTQTMLFTQSTPSVVFNSNQYLVVYHQIEEGLSSLWTVLLNLDGAIIDGPNHIIRFEQGVRPQGLELASKRQQRALVWFEADNTSRADNTRIQYVRLNQKGLPISGLKTMSEGLLRVFPNVEFDNLERLSVSWVQTDPDPILDLQPSLRVGVYDQPPACQ